MNNDNNWNAPKTEWALAIIGTSMFVWVVFNYITQLV